MQFSSTFVLAAVSLFSTTHAVITGIIGPGTIVPGTTFNLSLSTSDAQQTAANVAVAFGIGTGPGFYGTLGSTILGEEYLGASKSNIITPIDFTYTLDKDTPSGLVTITAAVFSLLGASNEYSISTYNMTVTIAASTDKIDPTTVSTARSPTDQASQSAAVVPNLISTPPPASSATHASGARAAAPLFPMGMNLFGF